jgi:hypothetical protein
MANGHVYDNAREVSPSSSFAQPTLLLLNQASSPTATSTPTPTSDSTSTSSPVSFPTSSPVQSSASSPASGSGSAPGSSALRFAPASPEIAGDLRKPVVGRGLATADLDDDGDLDVIVTTNGGAPLLLRNDLPHGHWLGVTCVGRFVPTIGARVQVTAGGRRQVKAIHGGGSYLSQSDTRLLFGLGDATNADITVTWPGGATRTRTTLKAVAVDAYVTIREH